MTEKRRGRTYRDVDEHIWERLKSSNNKFKGIDPITQKLQGIITFWESYLSRHPSDIRATTSIRRINDFIKKREKRQKNSTRPRY